MPHASFLLVLLSVALMLHFKKFTPIHRLHGILINLIGKIKRILFIFKYCKLIVTKSDDENSGKWRGKQK